MGLLIIVKEAVDCFNTQTEINACLIWNFTTVFFMEIMECQYLQMLQELSMMLIIAMYKVRFIQD